MHQQQAETLAALLGTPAWDRTPDARLALRSIVRDVAASVIAFLDGEDDDLDRLLHSAACVAYDCSGALAPVVVDPDASPDAVRIVVEGAIALEEPRISSSTASPAGAADDGGAILGGSVESRHRRILRRGDAFGLLAISEHWERSEATAIALVDDGSEGGSSSGHDDGMTAACTRVWVLELPIHAVQLALAPAFAREMARRAQHLRSCRLFADWPREPLLRLAVHLRQRWCADGQLLMRHGEEATECVFVASGGLDIFIHAHERPPPQLHAPSAHERMCARWELLRQSTTRRGAEMLKPLRRVATLGPGALVGEAALLTDGVRRNATILARGVSTELFALAKTDFLALDSAALARARDDAEFDAACSKRPANRTDADVAVLLSRVSRLPFFERIGEKASRAVCAAMVYARATDGTRVCAPPVIMPPTNPSATERESHGRGSQLGFGSDDLIVVLAGELRATRYISVLPAHGRFGAGSIGRDRMLDPLAISATSARTTSAGFSASRSRRGARDAPPPSATTGNLWRVLGMPCILSPGDTCGLVSALKAEPMDTISRASGICEVVAVPRLVLHTSGAAAALERPLRAIASALLRTSLFPGPLRAASHAAHVRAARLARGTETRVRERSLHDAENELLRIAPFFEAAQITRHTELASARGRDPVQVTVLIGGEGSLAVSRADAVAAARVDAEAAERSASLAWASAKTSAPHGYGASGTRPLPRASPAESAAQLSPRALDAAASGPREFVVAVLGPGFPVCAETREQISVATRGAPWRVVAETSAQVLRIDASDLAKLMHGDSHAKMIGRASQLASSVRVRVAAAVRAAAAAHAVSDQPPAAVPHARPASATVGMRHGHAPHGQGTPPPLLGAPRRPATASAGRHASRTAPARLELLAGDAVARPSATALGALAALSPSSTGGIPADGNGAWYSPSEEQRREAFAHIKRNLGGGGVTLRARSGDDGHPTSWRQLAKPASLLPAHGDCDGGRATVGSPSSSDCATPEVSTHRSAHAKQRRSTSTAHAPGRMLVFSPASRRPKLAMGGMRPTPVVQGMKRYC